jgi:hypothetical protein
MKRSTVLCLLAATPFAAAMVLGQVTTSTGGPAGHGTLTSNYVSGGLSNAFAIEAQPFTTPDPTNQVLEEFSFYYLPNASYPGNFLEAAIVEWFPTPDPLSAHPIGSPIWNSTPGTTTVTTISTAVPTNPYGGKDWFKFTFDAGSLVLDSAKTYAWVLTQNATSHSGDNQSGAFAFSAQTSNYAFGGKSFHSSTPWTYSGLQTAVWGSTDVYLAYSATFSGGPSVPDTSPVLALTATLAALGLIARRRRSA